MIFEFLDLPDPVFRSRNCTNDFDLKQLNSEFNKVSWKKDIFKNTSFGFSDIY